MDKWVWMDGWMDARENRGVGKGGKKEREEAGRGRRGARGMIKRKKSMPMRLARAELSQTPYRVRGKDERQRS